ncbi:phage tail protein [Escherichia coli]|nr:phage tail protein [Escherichia coli]
MGISPVVKTGETARDRQILEGFKKVRLGAGAPAIGIPFFWPSSAMPNTVMTEWADMVFLKFNGATFSAATYPKLALVIPSLTLPDARGEFPRIWDDGRGVDSGRALLSTQGDAVQRMTGSLSQMVYSIAQQASDINGVFSATSGTPNIVQAYSSAGALRYMNVSFDTQNVVRTSTETRSRNIAFNFLVRAK